jgi:hypothetical protein
VRRRRDIPLVPGERCPATRSNTGASSAVREFQRDTYGATGLRDCGRCGRKDVRVSRNGGTSGGPMSAWYYDAHTVPVVD